MKWLSVLCGLILASSCLAVFDLQQMSRDNSRATVASFLESLPKPGSGFLAVGEVGDDILLAEFDAYGVGMALREVQIGSDAAQYADGSLLVLVTTNFNSYLIRFTTGFAVQWEKKSPEEVQIATVDGSENSYVFGGSGLAVTYSPTGDLVVATSLNPFSPDRAKGIPGPGGLGVIVTGDNPATTSLRVIRTNKFLTQIYSQVSRQRS